MDNSHVIRRNWDRDGYCIVHNAIPTDLMDSLVGSLHALLSNSDAAAAAMSLDDLIVLRESQNHDAFYNACVSVGSSAAAYSLVGQSRIAEALADIAGVRYSDIHLMPIHMQIQLPSDNRFDYKWHQEGSFYPWCRDILSVWFPFVRGSQRATGTMAVLPGSHRGGLRDGNMYFSYGEFRQIESAVVDTEIDAEVAIEIAPGDVCFFHSNLVHKSIGNGGTLPRLNGILRAVNMATQPAYRPLYKAVGYET